jgi:hypothetical protein
MPRHPRGEEEREERPSRSPGASQLLRRWYVFEDLISDLLPPPASIECSGEIQPLGDIHGRFLITLRVHAVQSGRTLVGYLEYCLPPFYEKNFGTVPVVEGTAELKVVAAGSYPLVLTVNIGSTGKRSEDPAMATFAFDLRAIRNPPVGFMPWQRR